MSAPRPYEKNPFHPPNSVHVLTIVPISIYIQMCSSLFYHMVLTVCLGTVPFICQACALPDLVTPTTKSHFEVILFSMSSTSLVVLLRNTWHLPMCICQVQKFYVCARQRDWTLHITYVKRRQQKRTCVLDSKKWNSVVRLLKFIARRKHT